MDARLLFSLTVFIIAAAVLSSCTGDDRPAGPTVPESAPPVYIDESLVVDTSVSVGYSCLAVDHAVFDVSAIPMFANGEYDDIHVHYMTMIVQDEEHLVFNFNWQGWNILVPGREHEVPVQPAPGLHGHTFSETGLPISDFLDDSLHIWLRPYFFSSFLQPSEIAIMMDQGYYRLKGVTYHPGYDSARVPIAFSGECGGFAFDGTSYSLATHRNELVQYSSTGAFTGRIPCTMTLPQSLAIANDGFLIGDIYWTTEIIGLVRHVTSNGDEAESFDLPSIWPGALLMDGSSIWVAGGDRGNPGLYRLDATASFASGSAVIEDFLPFEKPIAAVASDGVDLLVASDSLFVLTTQGERVNAYPWPVSGVRGLSCDSGTLHLLGGAPVGLPSEVFQVTRFKMR